MGVWGIVAVLVIGIGAVAYGWLSDRTTDKNREEAMRLPPEREIPRFEGHQIQPHYLSELEAVTRPDGLPATDLTDAERQSLGERLPGAPSFPAGWPAREFVTDTTSGWCVLDDPAILICTDPITAMRELLPAVKRSREADRPLVLVAPQIGQEVLTTLRANWVQGTFSCLPLQVADAAHRRSLGSLTGAQPVSSDDLQAGYLPASHVGGCQAWVSDQGTSWALLEGLK